MSDHEDDLDIGNEPPTIDPYEVLNIERNATSDDVKKAYRKAALKHHPGEPLKRQSCNGIILTATFPDKVSDGQKEKAHETFQSIAFAYAVLSDPARRKRYDETGSTSESIVDSEGFNWSDYYREQFKDSISADAIEKFAEKYKGSDEEKDDILIAYEECEGDMDGIYERVILSDVLQDDERIREVIDKAIEDDDVPDYRAYSKETKRKREARLRRARTEGQKEEREAEEYAKELGVHDKLFGNKGSKGKKAGKAKAGSEDALAALIQKRQQDRSGDNFLDRLAEKYGASSKGKKGKKRASPPDEPPEELFQAAKTQHEARKAAREPAGAAQKRRKK